MNWEEFANTPVKVIFARKDYKFGLCGVVEPMVEAVLNTARNIHEGNYDCIILSGGSSFVSEAMLTAGWDRLGFGALPRVYKIPSGINSIIYKTKGGAKLDSTIVEWSNRERIRETKKYMARKIPEITQDMRRCFLDEFIDPGIKYLFLKKMFDKVIGKVDYKFFSCKDERLMYPGTFVGIVSEILTTRMCWFAKELQGDGWPGCEKEYDPDEKLDFIVKCIKGEVKYD